jgi:hypothetical protein
MFAGGTPRSGNGGNGGARVIKLPRACFVCGVEQPRRPDRKQETGPRVIAISLYLYWQSLPKRRPIAARKVMLCESCLAHAAIGNETPQSRKLGSLLTRTVASCYSSHTESGQ